MENTTTETLPPVPGFKVEVEISAEDIASLICSGFEGGVGYWCRIMDYCHPAVVRPVLMGERVFKHNDYPLLEGGGVICRDILSGEEVDEDEDEPQYTQLILDRAAVQRGLVLMMQKWPRHWGDFISGNHDATTGDVFIQLALLGDIVYG